MLFFPRLILSLRLLLIAVVLLSSSAITTYAKGEDSLALLLKLSGIADATIAAGPTGVQGLPDMLALSVDHLSKLVPDSTLNRIVDRVSHTVKAKDLSDWAVASYKQNLPSHYLRTLINEYRTPLFIQMAKAESAPPSAHYERDLSQFMHDPANFKDTLRRHICQQMEAEDQTTLASRQSQIAFVRGFLDGANELLTGSDKFSDREISSIVEQFQPRTSEASDLESQRESTVSALLYCYRNATTSELERYAEFWKTPAGRALNHANSAAILDIARLSGLRFGNRMIAMLQRVR